MNCVYLKFVIFFILIGYNLLIFVKQRLTQMLRELVLKNFVYLTFYAYLFYGSDMFETTSLNTSSFRKKKKSIKLVV